MWSTAAIFGAPVTEPPGKRRLEQLGEADVLAQRSLDGRDEVLDARELALGHQLGPADAAGLAHAREVVALEVDDHHVLGAILRRRRPGPSLAERPRALDRHRPDAAPAAREEELRRSRDDRPAVADERPRMQRPQRRKRRGERRGIALERRREVLDEVDLVDVAARDRRAHVARPRPRTPPATRSASTRPRRTRTRPRDCPWDMARCDTPAGAAGTARAAAAPASRRIACDRP